MARQQDATPRESVPLVDIDAEEALLGAMLLAPGAIDAAYDHVAARDFYRESHGLIFQACVDLYADGEPVDPVTVNDVLAQRNRLGDGQGLIPRSRTNELAANVPAASAAGRYAQIVREMATLRALDRAGRQITQLAQDRGARDAAAAVDAAEQVLFDVGQRRDRAGGDFADMAALVREAFDDVQALHDQGSSVIGVPTGFRDFDALTSGLQPGNLVVLAARPSMGKGLRLDAPVLTPTGWRRNGDLEVGDWIIGADGQPDVVTGVFDRGVLDFYRVTFSDGATVECSGDHLWLTKTRNERRRGAAGAVRDTDEIRATLTRPDAPAAANHSVPWVDPVEFAPGPPLPIDPYWLGLWLGDGTSYSQVILHNPEPDVQDAFARLTPDGDDARIVNDRDRARVTVRASTRTNAGSHALRALRALGLGGVGSHEKFVPDAYLFSSPADRLAVLQGIIDTDGYVTDPNGACIEVSTASPALREGIEFLAGSLGGRATSVRHPTHYTRGGVRHEARDAYRIVLSFPRGDVTPVRSRKHLAKWRGQSGRPRLVTAVDPAGRFPCRCITVGRGLYVTGRFVVTHNSSWALTVANNLVLAGRPVAFFTMEMSEKELTQRALAVEARVDLMRLRTGQLRGDEWSTLIGASERLQRAPLHIDDAGAPTLLDIRSKVRRLRARVPDLALVVVDYLQLMAQDAENRVQEISKISRGLKLLAREMNVPVLALSQLSRGVESRHDKRPILSDLRESGAIEQDADVVAFIYRDEYYNPEEIDQRGIAEIIVAKQRNGPTGTIKQAFLRRYATFSDLAPDPAVSTSPYAA